MLVIRLQRVGRKGHAQFRVVVQDSRRTPTSGKIVAHIGHYDPHTKNKAINKEKAQFYLDHGAQPSERVAKLLKDEGVKLPSWVKLADIKKRDTRNPEKLRRNQPKDETAEVNPEAEPVTDEVAEVAETGADNSVDAEASKDAKKETDEVAEATPEEPKEETKA